MTPKVFCLNFWDHFKIAGYFLIPKYQDKNSLFLLTLWYECYKNYSASGCADGSVLINALCDKASNEGHERVGLIVDFDNHKAEDLYFSLGFTRVGTRIFFGHKMWHLQRKQR